MIKSYTNGEWKEPGSLCQAVGIYKEDFHKIVSVVGGGGKTTVIRAMLRECMENSDGRIPCAVSTTPPPPPPPAEFFQEEVCRDPVLVLLEAVGAKHFPVKAPAEHEPVICEKTGIVLNVYGMRAIGKKIKDVCFRIGEVEKILGKTGEDILRPEDIMTLAVSRSAGRKCVTDEMEYQVILNQADTEEEKQTAMQLAVDIGKKLSEKYISEKNTKDTEFSGQISKVHVTSDLIPLEERW